MNSASHDELDAARWTRLSALFDAALDLPAHDRQAYVLEQCADDPPMQERLRRMLAADARADADEFLQSPLNAPDLNHFGVAEPEEYVPGSRQFGAYRLLRLIGRGGMGEVHLAERSDGQYEQRVALKLLPQPTPGLMQRFRQERQILARLEHPNIARLLDGGVGEENIPYFAMDYVDGMPITQYVVASSLDIAQRLRLFLGVCDAVQYAHRNLVVHRDIKPSNILIAADGSPKLLDFGIAKLLQATTGGQDTQTALRLFTPDYAAPEQIRGEAITTATDVYALGVVLYEMLTGSRPYRLGRDVALEQAILSVDPPAPSSAIERGPASVTRVRQLRGDLDRIVLTTLAKEPERRYPSVEALAIDIRSYLGGRPIAARGDGTWYRMRKFVSRNRVGVVALAFVLIALLAATGFSLAQARRAERERNVAVRTRDFVLGMLSNVGPYRRSVAPAPTLTRLIENSAPKILEEFSGEPQIQIPLLNSFAGVFMSLGHARDSSQYLEYALQRERASAASAQLVAETQLALANTYYYLRRFDDSNRVTAEVLADLANAPADEAHQRLGFSAREIRLLVAWSRGHVEQAEKIALALLDEVGKTLGRDNVETASAENYFVYLLLDRGEVLRAGTLIEHVAHVDIAAFPAGYPGNYGDALTIAWWLIEYGDAQAAEELAGKVLELRNRVYSGQGFAPAYSHFIRGWARCELGRYAEGLADYDDAQLVLAGTGNVGYMYQSRILLHQAKCQLDAGRTSDAAGTYAQARDMAIADGGAGTPNARTAAAGLAYIRWKGGDQAALSTMQQLQQEQGSFRDPMAVQTGRWLQEAKQGAAGNTPTTHSINAGAALAAMRLRLLALSAELLKPEAAAKAM